MTRRSFTLQILWPFLTLLLIALGVNTWGALRFMQDFDVDQSMDSLEIQARLVVHALESLKGDYRPEQVDPICKALGQTTGTRITAILPSGAVAGDSSESVGAMDKHGDRQEVRQALEGQVGRATRFSHTLHEDLVYVAVPIVDSGKTVLVVRASKSLAAVQQTMRRALTLTLLLGLAIAIGAVAAGGALARRISSPLQSMRRGAERFANGELESRVPIPGSVELADLANALNQMAAQLRERIQIVSRQRNELDAILSSMAEGVIAIGQDERILTVNRTACRWFGLDEDSARGRYLHEAVRNPGIHQCAARMLSEALPFEEECLLAGPGERHIRVSASPLGDELGNKIGALLVLNDFTQLHRLEQARSEFVANVSHEIRTPVTSIKGYAETLLAEPPPEPEVQRRFLEIMMRQADRLAALVDDILALAGLEGAETDRDAAMGPVDVTAILDAAKQACQPMALAKGMTIALSADAGLTVRGNAMLLEQALANLLDNAVKYTEAGGEVGIEARRAPAGIAIRVRDTGMGIPAEHLGRVFERFYRADRARSRSMGGTGLGLAIVKHIAALHQGQISVESTPGQGSVFSLVLPSA